MKNEIKLIKAAEPLFELNKIYVLQTPYDDYTEVENEDKKAILDLLLPEIIEWWKNRNSNGWADDDPEYDIYALTESKSILKTLTKDLETDIHWSWKEKGNNTVFTKRLSKYLANRINLDLRGEVKNKIGVTMTTKTKLGNKVKTCYFDFDKSISWEHGDFGDRNSCFWTSKTRENVRSFLRRDSRMHAIRFFKANPVINPSYLKYLKVDKNQPVYTNEDKTFHMQGIARSWLILDNIDGLPIVILFGAYGVSLPEIASVMKVFLQIDERTILTKNITLLDKGSSESKLFVGNSYHDEFQGKGILVGLKEVLNKIDTYDVGLDERQDVITPVPMPTFCNTKNSLKSFLEDAEVKKEFLTKESEPRLTEDVIFHYIP